MMSITHVSDTARWVAYYRAMESERPDALFRDPYARQLAGPKGEEIVHSLDRGAQAAWSMIVRTAVIDEILLRHVASDGVDCVLNLAAGLDTRPFRMALPSSLRWVDVDFADVLDYKWAVLRAERASCVYERVAADLANATERREVIARVGAEHRRVFVIAEGLLIYLGADDVRQLAGDLAGPPSLQWWLFDLASPRLLQWMQRSWGKKAALGNAPFRFAPEEGTAFFAPAGWRELEFHSSWSDAMRLKRRMRLWWLWGLMSRLMPRARREQAQRMAGLALMGRG